MLCVRKNFASGSRGDYIGDLPIQTYLKFNIIYIIRIILCPGYAGPDMPLSPDSVPLHKVWTYTPEDVFVDLHPKLTH